MKLYGHRYNQNEIVTRELSNHAPNVSDRAHEVSNRTPFATQA